MNGTSCSPVCIAFDNICRLYLLKAKTDKMATYYSVMKTAHNWDEFQRYLRKSCIEIGFKYEGQTSEVQGIHFTKDGLFYKDLQVDRSFSFLKLNIQLWHANHQEQPKQAF